MRPCDESAEPHVHRVKTFAAGGDNALANCVTACATCHATIKHEAIPEAVTCPACDTPMTAGNAGCLPYFENGTGMTHRRLRHEGPGACHDCGVKVGAVHHDGCDLEECPRCGNQMLTHSPDDACGWAYVAEEPPAKGRR